MDSNVELFGIMIKIATAAVTSSAFAVYYAFQSSPSSNTLNYYARSTVFLVVANAVACTDRDFGKSFFSACSVTIGFFSAGLAGTIILAIRNILPGNGPGSYQDTIWTVFAIFSTTFFFSLLKIPGKQTFMTYNSFFILIFEKGSPINSPMFMVAMAILGAVLGFCITCFSFPKDSYQAYATEISSMVTSFCSRIELPLSKLYFPKGEKCIGSNLSLARSVLNQDRTFSTSFYTSYRNSLRHVVVSKFDWKFGVPKHYPSMLVDSLIYGNRFLDIAFDLLQDLFKSYIITEVAFRFFNLLHLPMQNCFKAYEKLAQSLSLALFEYSLGRLEEIHRLTHEFALELQSLEFHTKLARQELWGLHHGDLASKPLGTILSEHGEDLVILKSKLGGLFTELLAASVTIQEGMKPIRDFSKTLRNEKNTTSKQDLALKEFEISFIWKDPSSMLTFKEIVVIGLKASLATLLGSIFALNDHAQQALFGRGYWVCIAIGFIYTDDPHVSFSRGMQRCTGTVFGSFIAWFYAEFIFNYPQSLVIFTMCSAVFFKTVSRKYPDYDAIGPSMFNALIVSLFDGVVDSLNSGVDDINSEQARTIMENAGYGRIMATITGGIIAIVISYLFYPRRPGRDLFHTISDTLKDVQKMILMSTNSDQVHNFITSSNIGKRVKISNLVKLNKDENLLPWWFNFSNTNQVEQGIDDIFLGVNLMQRIAIQSRENGDSILDYYDDNRMSDFLRIVGNVLSLLEKKTEYISFSFHGLFGTSSFQDNVEIDPTLLEEMSHLVHALYDTQIGSRFQQLLQRETLVLDTKRASFTITYLHGCLILVRGAETLSRSLNK